MLLVSILWLFAVCGSDGQITQMEFTVLPDSYFTPVADALIVRQQSIALGDPAATECARSCVNSLNRCDVAVYSKHDQMCRVYINTGGFHRSSPGYTTFIGSNIDLPVTRPTVLPGKNISRCTLALNCFSCSIFSRYTVCDCR